MLDTPTSEAHDAIARVQREPKYWGLKRHLLEVLGSLPPGSPIPTERSLAAKLAGESGASGNSFAGIFTTMVERLSGGVMSRFSVWFA